LSFLIICNNCGESNEFKDGFLKREKEIQVYDAGEFIVAIKCTKCGNEVVSSYDE
jgi:ribosomal protein S27E